MPGASSSHIGQTARTGHCCIATRENSTNHMRVMANLSGKRQNNNPSFCKQMQGHWKFIATVATPGILNFTRKQEMLDISGKRMIQVCSILCSMSKVPKEPHRSPLSPTQSLMRNAAADSWCNWCTSTNLSIAV